MDIVCADGSGATGSCKAPTSPVNEGRKRQRVSKESMASQASVSNKNMVQCDAGALVEQLTEHLKACDHSRILETLR